MKNLNKVFALLVVFTMVLSTVVFASPFDDVSDDANYAEAVITLSTLGLFKGDDKGNFNPDKTITRAEFATVVVRTMGMGDPGPTATVFTDVPATHWASGYVQAATNIGILAGYGDGTFGPDDPVTYEQAIKMIVAALGYTPEAENRGGYPTGYMMIAAREGITEGANGKVGEQAPRATVAQLLYNALDVPLMVQTGFGSQVTYEVMDGRNDRDFQTILSSKLGITKVEGVITNNYLTEDIGARNKKVKIEITRVNDMRITDYQDKIDDVDDKPNILVGNTNAKDYLGYTVVGYVKDFDTTDATFLSVTPKTGKNQVITVTDMANIDDNDDNSLLTSVTSGYRFEYWRDRDTDKRAEQVDVSANYKYYRNGLEEKDAPTKPASGKVVLLDNDDDDIYDYIFVTEYRYVVVDEVFDGDVQSLTSYGVFFDDDDDDLEYVIYLDGKEIGWEDLEKWDVISLVVTEGNNGKTRYTAYVTRDSVQGIVNEDLSDDYGTKYGIDGKEYVFVDDVEGASVRLGNEYTFFLNVDGNVVYVEKGTTVGGRKTPFNYAILYNAAIESTLSDTLQVELFTSEGKWVVYETSDRVYINGDRFDVKNLFNAISNRDSRLKDLFTVSGDSIKVVEPTLIAYKLDSSGYLRDLDFARDGINKDDYISRDDASDSALYRASTKRLGKGYITDYTVIFAIKGEGTRKEDYSIVTASAFTDGESYKAYLYDIEEGNEVSAIVAFDVTGTVGEEAGFFVVKSVSESRDEDDDTIYIFRGLQDGKETTITVSDDVYVTKLVPKAGNSKVYIDETVYAAETAPSSFIKNMKEYVIQYSVNARDEVDSIRIIYDPNDEDFYADAFSADIGKENSDLVISYGKVTDKRSGRLSISTMDGTREVTSVNVSGAKFTQINYDYAPSSRVRTSSINDVKVDSSIVIVREYDGAVKDIVIINGK